MLCSVAMFPAEEEPDKPQHMQRNSEMLFDIKSMQDLFSHFLERINIIELSPFISQIWWQLSSGVVAERWAWERCEECWNLHRREEEFFLCIWRSEGLFFRACFCWRS